MKNFLINHYWLISLLASFLLFWIFGDIIVFLIILGVIGFFILMKGVYKATFLYMDIVLFILYLLFGFICLVFLSFDSVKILVIVLGVWLISSFFLNKRL